MTVSRPWKKTSGFCAVPLIRVAYEGVRAWRCRGCNGYLVGRHGAEGIKKRQIRKRDDLETESVRERSPDIHVDQPCPKCFAMMEKERLRKPVPILLDRCERCDLVWFDGGELALFQMAYESSQKGRTSARFRRRLAAPQAVQEVRHQQGDVFTPLPQRRQIDGDDLDPVVEILTHPAGRQKGFQIAVRGRDDPHINGHRPVVADFFDALLLQGPQQLHLDDLAHIPDLIQKDGAAVGLLEAPAARSHCASERPFDVTEELALQQTL